MPDDKQLQTVLSELSDQGRSAPVQQPATEIAPTSVKRSVKFENEELMLWRHGSKHFIREQSDTKLQLSGAAAYLIQAWYRKLVRTCEPASCGQVCEPGVNVCSIEELAEDLRKSGHNGLDEALEKEEEEDEEEEEEQQEQQEQQEQEVEADHRWSTGTAGSRAG